MSAVNVKKLLRLSWLFGILTVALFPFVIVLAQFMSIENYVHLMLFGLFGLFVLVLGIISIGFLIGVRSQLSGKERKPYIILTVISGLLFIIVSILPDSFSDKLYFLAIGVCIVGIFFLSFIYVFTLYLHLFDYIFLVLLGGIVIGLILNQFGIQIARFIIGFCFFLSFLGFLFTAIMHSKRTKENKPFRRIVSSFCYINCFIFLLLFFKFSSEQPAFTRTLDAIGVILFLLASITLFIILPFSNFIEWLKSQRQFFYRVILLPFLFFLVVFSLTFLLPDSTYRKIFFIEFSSKEKVHFDMKDYESDID